MKRPASAQKRAPKPPAARDRGRKKGPPPDPEAAAAEEVSDLTPAVGGNLRRFRADQGLTLEKLAALSGVSRAMLSQIELEQSTPTINVLWKIARALGVPFSALISQPMASSVTVLPAARARILLSQDGTFSSRALFPFDRASAVEFYELKLAAHSSEHAEAHAPGTLENLVVASGSLEMTVGEERHTMSAGDSIVFQADVPHVYRNPGKTELVMYLVMTYARRG